MNIPNKIPEDELSTDNNSDIFTTLKVVNKFKHSLSIKDLEKTTSNNSSERYIENDDLLHHNDNKLNPSCIRYKSTKSLYIERSELISIRDIMLYGKTQSVSRLLYYFWMDKDKDHGHLRSLNSLFLQDWLRGKIEMVQRDIPFIFDTEHQENNLKHMIPNTRDKKSLEMMTLNVFGDNELIDRYGRFSAGSLMKINVEIGIMDDKIKKRDDFHTKCIAFFCSIIYLIGQIYLTFHLSPDDDESI